MQTSQQRLDESAVKKLKGDLSNTCLSKHFESLQLPKLNDDKIEAVPDSNDITNKALTFDQT